MVRIAFHLLLNPNYMLRRKWHMKRNKRLIEIYVRTDCKGRTLRSFLAQICLPCGRQLLVNH